MGGLWSKIRNPIKLWTPSSPVTKTFSSCHQRTSPGLNLLSDHPAQTQKRREGVTNWGISLRIPSVRPIALKNFSSLLSLAIRWRITRILCLSWHRHRSRSPARSTSRPVPASRFNAEFALKRTVNSTCIFLKFSLLVSTSYICFTKLLVQLNIYDV